MKVAVIGLGGSIRHLKGEEYFEEEVVADMLIELGAVKLKEADTGKKKIKVAEESAVSEGQK